MIFEAEIGELQELQKKCEEWLQKQKGQVAVEKLVEDWTSALMKGAKAIELGCEPFFDSRNACATAGNYKNCMEIKMGRELNTLEKNCLPLLR